MGSGHEEGGQDLAALAGVSFPSTSRKAAGFQGEWEMALFLVAFDAGAEFFEGVEDAVHGAFAHGGGSVQMVGATGF